MLVWLLAMGLIAGLAVLAHRTSRSLARDLRAVASVTAPRGQPSHETTPSSRAPRSPAQTTAQVPRSGPGVLSRPRVNLGAVGR